jgi:hypothetical protein
LALPLSGISYQASVISLDFESVIGFAVIRYLVSVIRLGFDFGVAIWVEGAKNRRLYPDGDRVFTGQVHHLGDQWVPFSGIRYQSGF